MARRGAWQSARSLTSGVLRLRFWLTTVKLDWMGESSGQVWCRNILHHYVNPAVNCVSYKPDTQFTPTDTDTRLYNVGNSGYG